MNLIEQEPQPASQYRTIPLTKGYVAIVDAEDYERIVALGSWQATPRNHTIYATRCFYKDGSTHHLAMGRFILGITDPKLRVDHWDHDGLNNRRYNLRVCNNQQNSANSRKRHRNTGSAYKCVRKRTFGWQAYITVNRELIHLGTFKSEEAAARAYDAAAIEHFGEFACLNFPAEVIA